MTRKETVASRDYVYKAVFEPAEEGGWLVRFPAIKGLVTEGDTLDEAREMARDALRCFIEAWIRDGLPLPSSDVSPAKQVREPAYPAGSLRGMVYRRI